MDVRPDSRSSLVAGAVALAGAERHSALAPLGILSTGVEKGDGPRVAGVDYTARTVMLVGRDGQSVAREPNHLAARAGARSTGRKTSSSAPATVSAGPATTPCPMGRYAHDEIGCRRGAVGYTDYSAGRDGGLAFRTGLEEAGGTIVEEVAMGGAVEVPDFRPFFQRVNDAAPDCFYVFVPPGPHDAALLEAYVETGMKDRGSG